MIFRDERVLLSIDYLTAADSYRLLTTSSPGSWSLMSRVANADTFVGIAVDSGLKVDPRLVINSIRWCLHQTTNVTTFVRTIICKKDV